MILILVLVPPLCHNDVLVTHHECIDRIPDPKAKKPADWDEDAPKQIEDPDAKKPEGWLDDEPGDIDDPGMIKHF